MNCCDTCPFSPTCEEEEDQASHSYRPCDHGAGVIPDDRRGEAVT